jgi:hypothetical protein
LLSPLGGLDRPVAVPQPYGFALVGGDGGAPVRTEPHRQDFAGVAG